MPVRQVITGGRKGEEVIENPDWGHGAFTYKLLEALRTGASDWNADGATTGAELATYLKNVVPNIADQSPQSGYFEGEGEFLFLHGQTDQVNGNQPPDSPANEIDTERPQISILEPASARDTRSITVTQKEDYVEIAGVATDDVGVVRVEVDGKVVPTTAAGSRSFVIVGVPETSRGAKFKARVDRPPPGQSKQIAIQASDAAGNAAVLNLTVASAWQNGISADTEAPGQVLSPMTQGDMVRIPAGEFRMGGDSGDTDGRPVQTVWVDAFYIDKYEVTNAQFARFLNTLRRNDSTDGYEWIDLRNPACLIEKASGTYRARSGFESHPVILVSWYGARDYAEFVGKRLPTEAEWEKAARGRQEGTIYPWGSHNGKGMANYDQAGDRRITHIHLLRFLKPVGNYPANGYGLHDMGGNVAEWCADVYDSVNSSGNRVLRGASWLDAQEKLRCASRVPGVPHGMSMDIGFRCAKDAENQ